MQEQSMNQWENGVRVVKTSEDQYERSHSTSSESSIHEESASPRLNVQNPSLVYNNASVKPEYNRVRILFTVLTLYRHRCMFYSFFMRHQKLNQ